MKICKICKIEKDEKEFYEKLKGSGKLKYICKPCEKAYIKSRYKSRAKVKSKDEDENGTDYPLCKERVKAIYELYYGDGGKKGN